MIFMHLKIEGVEGESKDELYSGWMEILAWSWGVGQGYERDFEMDYTHCQDISLTKWIDCASPVLCKSCLEKRVFPEATLELRRGNVDKDLYVVYKLKDCKITSCSFGGSGGEDRLTENISISFKQMDWIYYPPKSSRKENDTVVKESIVSPPKYFRKKKNRNR